jgi:hypothetical protein
MNRVFLFYYLYKSSIGYEILQHPVADDRAQQLRVPYPGGVETGNSVLQ